MGLLDKIKSAFSTGSSDGQVPVSASFATRDDVVYAPVSGVLVSLKEVNDEVLSAGLLGDGYGIVPVGNGVLYSPVNGRIGATTVTNHAIGISTADGGEVLIHIGIGTVDMDGKGFTRYVEANDEVKAGQPLISFDRDAIAAAGHEDVVACVVSNPDAFQQIEHVLSAAHVPRRADVRTMIAHETKKRPEPLGYRPLLCCMRAVGCASTAFLP